MSENNSNQTINATAETSGQQETQQTQQPANNEVVKQTQQQQQEVNPKLEILKARIRSDMGQEALAATEPHLTAYIAEDLKEKSALRSENESLRNKNIALESQLGRVNDVVLLAKYGFDASQYPTILKLCDYNITDESLIDLSKQSNYDWLKAKRSAQRAQANLEQQETDPLFSDLISSNRKF